MIKFHLMQLILSSHLYDAISLDFLDHCGPGIIGIWLIKLSITINEEQYISPKNRES